MSTPHHTPRALTVLVIAKEPVAGRVKTRLTPPFTPEQAARLARAALVDTLETVRALPVTRRVVMLDGQPGPWLPDGFEVLPQGQGGLDARIAHSFAQCTGPALLIGMDTPQLQTSQLAGVLDANAWDATDAWYGPATDGGFWALAFREPRPELVRGVPMSRPDTGALQRRRLVEAGLRVADLPPLTDVDTAADAAYVATRCAGTFATEHAAALAELPAPASTPTAGAETTEVR